ncbi:NAD(P)H-binding protein [Lysobacter sp. K5869]|uniref:NAD(P)H-binding protein n=1 Tax=Lysobacter sp. K5869 TaxID=2820808 RepID=UPI001C0623D3|nr:NAD(P)H-binding protein [Lysobacter sp. K5869]QWP77091.1 NAD(P)H-binding protein [Lysobacter sp. K5869]
MKIGIGGASGQLGAAAVTQTKARAGAAAVVAISRTPQAVRGADETRHGDYDRPDSLLDAYRGLDRLLLVPGPDVRPGVRARQLVAAIDAAVAAGVSHVVLISSAATREAAEPSMYAPYWAAEQHLMRTAPRWTILRMNYFAESFAQILQRGAASGVIAGLAENRVAYVAREDVAAAAAGILAGDGHAGAIYHATGPAALGGAQRAAIAAEALDQPLRFVAVDEARLRAGIAAAGIPAEYGDAVVDIEKSFAAGSFDIVTGDVERLSGRAPMALSDVLQRECRRPAAQDRA